MCRWWKDSGMPEANFTQHRHMEYYALASCIAFEPQHSGFRFGFAKLSHIITVLDDMYGLFGTIDELELFTAAIKRFSFSIHLIPEVYIYIYIYFPYLSTN